MRVIFLSSDVGILEHIRQNKILSNLLYGKAEFALLGIATFIVLIANLFVERLYLNDAIVWDAETYAYMTQQGVVLQDVQIPFGYRILVPFIAHFIPLSIQARFELLNSLSILLISILLYRFLKSYFPNHALQCWIATLFWLTTGVLAVYFYYPVMVDLPLMVFMLISLKAAHKGRHGRFMLFLILAALTKEIGLLVIIYHAAYHRHLLKTWSGRFRLAGYYLPGLLAFLLIHNLVAPLPSATYSYGQTALNFFSQKLSWRGLLQLILAFFTTYDVILLMLLFSLRSITNFLRRQPEAMAYLAVSVPFVLIGGTNLELFWFYLFPIFYLISTAALVDGWELWSRPLFWITMAAYHLFAARFFFIGYPQDIELFSQLWAYRMTDYNLLRNLTAFCVLFFAVFFFYQINVFGRLGVKNAEPHSN